MWLNVRHTTTAHNDTFSNVFQIIKNVPRDLFLLLGDLLFPGGILEDPLAGPVCTSVFFLPYLTPEQKGTQPQISIISHSLHEGTWALQSLVIEKKGFAH